MKTLFEDIFSLPDSYLTILKKMVDSSDTSVDIDEDISKIENHYAHFAGKCYLYVWQWWQRNNQLLVQAGFYECPFWGSRTHWWLIDENGEVFDPTCSQFPSRGMGEYIPLHEASVSCCKCGQYVPTHLIGYWHHNHNVCSDRCYGRLIGFPTSSKNEIHECDEVRSSSVEFLASLMMKGSQRD